ncbi:MAG: hypothetical protein AAGF11_37840 [Myxococcota bacterium]
MRKTLVLFGLIVGATAAFGGCDVEDVEGSDWRDEAIIALEQELAVTQDALDAAQSRLVDASAPVASEDAVDGGEVPVDADEDLARPSYACCVPDNSDPPRGVCKKGGSYDTEDECDDKGGIFFSSDAGQDGYARCTNECDGKIWTGNPPADADAVPLE